VKKNLAFASMIAVTAGAAGVGAFDQVPAMVGADSMKDLTIAILNNCAALHVLGDPIQYDGIGSATGEFALRTIGFGAKQMVAPMSRPLGSGICSGPTAAQRQGAEGMVIALAGVAIVGSSANVGAEGIDYPGAAQNPFNNWREVLRLVYTGMPSSVGNNVFLRDCNSQARKDIVNNWDNVFHGTVNACMDSHPSVPGSGAAGYDQSNAIVEPGIRHAFRPDDQSGVTEVFLGQLSLSPIDFAQTAPAGSTTVQAAVYRALGNSPFCNNKRPEDKWAPVTMAANSTLGFNSSQIPEMTLVGVPPGAGTGLGYAPQLVGSSNPVNLTPYVNEYMDQDPIRRKCVGRGNNANASLPFEQVCGADGTLGVVLPISVPAELTTAERYPLRPCEPGLGFGLGPTLMRPTLDPLRCPNGDATQDGQCLLPLRTEIHMPGGVAFDCLNPPGNVPQAYFDGEGDGSQYPDAPRTDGRTDVDGRVYNQILRKPNGDIVTVLRNNPARLGLTQVPVAASFYRIHTTRSILPPPLHTTATCGFYDNATDQIGCLTRASPCSIGFAGRGALTNNPGTTSALVNGIPNTAETIRAQITGGVTYPFAHRLYLNTVQGFEALLNSSSVFPGVDAEEEMAKCFATLPFNGTININAFGFVRLPAPAGLGQEQPLCMDVNGQALCTGTSNNTDACIGNELISGGVVPTSSCTNGLLDGAEVAPDVCPAAHPACNLSTHHCE
jgi:hypothetical protein